MAPGAWKILSILGYSAIRGGGRLYQNCKFRDLETGVLAFSWKLVCLDIGPELKSYVPQPRFKNETAEWGITLFVSCAALHLIGVMLFSPHEPKSQVSFYDQNLIKLSHTEWETNLKICYNAFDLLEQVVDSVITDLIQKHK